jgi:long-subunit fatty acid transport protein
MKKLLLFTFLLCSLSGFSQFGLEVGFGSSKAKVSDGNVSVSSDSYSGVIAGLVYNFSMSEKVKLETGVSFSFFKVDGESSNGWGIPLVAKIYPKSDNGFHIRAGVGYGATLEDVDTTIVKKDAFSGGFGLGYDIDDNFTIVAEYSTQLSNSAGSDLDDIEIKGSGFGVSLQYFF